ncbi:PREDICTED: protein SYM1-like isoform X2 [Camelina sativa]|uniref:Protein SYM1-like isoform X2 n=1 Tax=Camelina sativa TaxID=90675 RepID=A0ABM1QR35_CAMSA|nr:PREDICTED: protein SYM1-like isoform X2 [Camelina sativa]
MAALCCCPTTIVAVSGKLPSQIRIADQLPRLSPFKNQRRLITSKRRSLVVVGSIIEDREAIQVKSVNFEPQEERKEDEEEEKGEDRDNDRLMSRGINAAIVLAAGTVAVTKLLSIDHDYWQGWTLYEILRYAPEHNWVAYEQILKTNPVLAKMAISGIVYSLGDWIAQCYEGKPLFEFDRSRVVRSGLVGFTLHGSLSHYYYQFCEALFPFQEWWVVPAKIAFDQTVWSAIWNSIYFTVLGLLRFQSPADIFSEIKPTFWPMITAGWKLWPLAHLVTYGVVPVDQRLLWVDCIELIWVTILSTYSNEKAEAPALEKTNSNSSEE